MDNVNNYCHELDVFSVFWEKTQKKSKYMKAIASIINIVVTAVLDDKINVQNNVISFNLVSCINTESAL